MKMVNGKWKRVRLGDYCRIISGSTPKTAIPAYWDGEIPWATPKDLSGLDTQVLQDTHRRITPSGLKSCAAQILPKGSVLFSSRAPIGLVAIAGQDMSTNQGFKSLVPGDKVDSGYLYWVMKDAAPRIAALGRGATFKEVSKGIVEDYEIPLPPLEEQKRIAAILDKADAIRKKRAQALTLLDDFLQALFLDMFGDPVTNPKGWPAKRLGEELSFMTSGSRGWAKHYSASGALFIRIQNVGSNRMNFDEIAFVQPPESAEARRTRVMPGDVLLSITADLGRTAVVPGNIQEGYINQHLAILRPMSMAPEYLSEYLASEGGKSQITALNRNGVKAGLNFDDIRSLSVLCPPIDLQRQFASTASQALAIRDRHLESQSLSVLTHGALSQYFLKAGR